MRLLRVHRKAFDVRKDVKPGRGVVMKTIHIPATTFKIKDKGLPGRGKQIIKIKRKGALTKLGFSADLPMEQRRRTLVKAAKKYGEKSVGGMLASQAIFRKRTNPSLSKQFAADRRFIMGSFINKYHVGQGKGWHSQRKEHSNARRYGHK